MASKRKRRREVTLSDVARRANVSLATVSYAFNGTGAISAETREMVLSIVDEMGYRAGTSSRGLDGSPSSGSAVTNRIALLQDPMLHVEMSKSDYYSRLAYGVQSALDGVNKHLILTKVEADTLGVPSVITGGHVEGAICVSPLPAALLRRIAFVVPVVLLNTRVAGCGLSYVMPDDGAGVRLAAEHLLNLGHRRITYFSIHDSDPPNPHQIARATAFRNASESAPAGGWMRSTVLTTRSKSLVDTAADTLDGWRHTSTMPTGLVCASDTYAFAFQEAAARADIRVPEDLSIIGMNDSMFCENSRPPLTSVRQPLEAMSREAVKLLLERVSDSTLSQTRATCVFGVTLIERASCCRPT